MEKKVFFSEQDQTFNIRFSDATQTLGVRFKDVQPITEYVGGELYGGSYEITPKINAQEMQTEGKTMLENVTIKSIPFHKVGNASGGNTVHIGDDI